LCTMTTFQEMRDRQFCLVKNETND